MKTAIVLIICCLAVTLADPVENYLKECQKQLNISDADIEDPTKNSCFLSCMHKKTGVMRLDGTLNVDKIVADSPKDVDKVKLREKLQACIDKANGEACALSACVSSEKI